MFAFLAPISIAFCYRKQLSRMTVPHRCPCYCVMQRLKAPLAPRLLSSLLPGTQPEPSARSPPEPQNPATGLWKQQETT